MSKGIRLMLSVIAGITIMCIMILVYGWVEFMKEMRLEALIILVIGISWIIGIFFASGCVMPIYTGKYQRIIIWRRLKEIFKMKA